MNKVFLIGNLTRDPEISETTSGVKICRFSIAVNRNYTGPDGEKKTDFFSVVAWRGLAENIAKYARKGNKLAVSGSIELRVFEDSQGIKRTAVDIIAQDAEFLTPRQSESADGYYTQPALRDAVPRQRDAVPRQNARKPVLVQYDDDEDIPF